MSTGGQGGVNKSEIPHCLGIVQGKDIDTMQDCGLSDGTNAYEPE